MTPFGTAIRDFIFPLALVRQDERFTYVERILGTGFLVGNRGFALTAAHVLRSADPELTVAAMFAVDNRWVAASVPVGAFHDSEDVALFRIVGGGTLPTVWTTPFRLRTTWEGASRDYMLWGYPEDLFFERDDLRDISGRVPPRPDLVCCKGYIRRRVTMSLPAICGTEFFEVSDLAGSGCSGSPVFINRTPDGAWDVIGVYVGERQRKDGVSVGYAVRIESLKDWAPELLGKTVVEESQAFTA